MHFDNAEGVKAWLQIQRNWLQEAAAKLLQKKELSPEDIDYLFELIKTEEGQLVSTSHEFPELTSLGGNETSLTLDKIGNIAGIENLSPRKPLIFGDGNLTIVYGLNGSGKSSYSKIIKNVSGKPRAPVLKANVFDELPAVQKCDISFKRNGQDHMIEWHTTTRAIDELRSIDVFDTEEAEFYLSKENAFTYTPQILKIFETLAQVCDLLKNRLQNEQLCLQSNLPDFPLTFHNTEIAKHYLNLRHDFDDAQVEDLISWDQEDEGHLTGVITRLSENDHASKAKLNRQKKSQVEKLVMAIQSTSTNYSLEKIKEIYLHKVDSDNKQKVAAEAALTLDSQLEGVGSDTWKAMWEAARTYSQKHAYKTQLFPVVSSSKCVLCQQDISDDAEKRLQRFESFIQGKLEQDAKTAYKIYEEHLTHLFDVYTPQIINDLCDNSGLGEDWKNVLNSYFDVARELKNDAIANKTIDQLNPLRDVSKIVKTLNEYAISLEQYALQLEQDAQKIDREALEKERIALEAKKWISGQAESIRKEIDRLKRIDQYNKWIALLNSRPISTKANQLAETIITQAYIDRFNSELRALGAHKIKVELVKSKALKGTVLHKIQLKDAKTKVPVETILSEGERRIIALAAFLADVTHKPIISPFIFDDPICSLDQNWEEKTIDRLIQLSKERQVIIFTHRLSMLSLLVEKSENPNCIYLSQESWGVGECSELPLFAKRVDKALNSLKDGRLSKARNVYETEGNDYYYPLAKAICSDIRIVTERIVETVLLADVVQRNRRAVHTLKISKLAHIEKEDCDFIHEMMTKYSCYEHSQSLETPVGMPEPDELHEDLEKLIHWHTTFAKKVNAA